jgi:hypothetical protein
MKTARRSALKSVYQTDLPGYAGRTSPREPSAHSCTMPKEIERF